MSIPSKLKSTDWRKSSLASYTQNMLLFSVTCIRHIFHFDIYPTRNIFFVCRFLFVSLLAIGVSACQRSDQLASIKREMADLKKTSQHQAMVTAKSEFQLPQPVTYHRMVSATDTESKSADQRMQLLQPLQAYSINNYQFIGTLTRHQQTVAYLKAPNDIVYQVKRGDILGTESGEITDITSGQLSVLVNDTSKKPPRKRVITMQLREQQ